MIEPGEGESIYGWIGRIPRVDLSKSEVTEPATQPYAEKFPGGRGIATRIYWDEVAPGMGYSFS